MKNLLTGDFMIIIYFFLSSIRFTIMSMGDLSKIEDHKYDKNAFMPFEKNCYGSNMLGRIIRIFLLPIDFGASILHLSVFYFFLIFIKKEE